MLRYTIDRARPGLVALYDIRSGNGAGQFLQPRSPHGAVSCVECELHYSRTRSHRRRNRCIKNVNGKLHSGVRALGSQTFQWMDQAHVPLVPPSSLEPPFVDFSVSRLQMACHVVT